VNGGTDADARGLEIRWSDPWDTRNQDPVRILGNSVEFSSGIFNKHDSFRIILPASGGIVTP
jgi:hypothetical protein